MHNHMGVLQDKRKYNVGKWGVPQSGLTPLPSKYTLNVRHETVGSHVDLNRTAEDFLDWPLFLF